MGSFELHVSLQMNNKKLTMNVKKAERSFSNSAPAVPPHCSIPLMSNRP